MAWNTAGLISVQMPNEVKTIYCYRDGHPSHVGYLLLHFYRSQTAAESIVALGNLCFLGRSVESPPQHSLKQRKQDFTVACGRDRGEAHTRARSYPSLIEALAKEETDYNYYWNGHRWYVNGYELTQEFLKLAEQNGA
jgi:hypothetical protein